MTKKDLKIINKMRKGLELAIKEYYKDKKEYK